MARESQSPQWFLLAFFPNILGGGGYLRMMVLLESERNYLLFKKNFKPFALLDGGDAKTLVARPCTEPPGETFTI